MSNAGRKSPSPNHTRTISLALNMPADHYRDLYEIAVSERCSISEMASRALQEWVAEQKKLNHS